MKKVFIVYDSDEDDDDAPLVVSRPPPASQAPHTQRLPIMQNGSRFSGPGLPFDAIVGAAISSGIFNVGHTCNVAKRSSNSLMCRIECDKCNSRIILHLKEGFWEVTQSGLCKKRVKSAANLPSPIRVAVLA